MKGNALIRHCFSSVEIDSLNDEDWAQKVAEAMYVKSFEAQLIAIEVGKLFGGGKTTATTAQKPKGKR